MKPTATRSVRSLIEEQVQRWARQQQERETAAGGPPQHWPLVTVSREFGSLGATTARVVAERLRFTFWDQELVTAIAQHTGAQQALLASVDENTRSKIEEFVANIVFGTGGTTAEYIREVARVVRVLDRQGAAVVVGRGAQFIVEPARALRVRVVSPYAARVEGYARRMGLSPREAERKVSTVERGRRTFVRQHYGRDIADASAYDLAINTDGVAIEAVADVIIAAYQAKFGRLPPEAR